jgi:hypothetical protein
MSDVIDLAGPFCLVNRRLMAPLALLALGVGSSLAAMLRLGKAWPWEQVWLVLAGFLLVANGLFTLAAGELLFHPPREIRLRTLFRRFAHRLLPFLATRLLYLLVLAISALFIVPLPIFLARLHFTSEAVLLESASPFESFRRSTRLVLFRSFPCLGLAVASLLVPFLFAAAADLIGDTLVQTIFQMGQPFGSLWSDGGSGYAVAGALLSAPFVASLSFLGYVDMRTRKEGWDIQLRFLALAEAESQSRRMRT